MRKLKIKKTIRILILIIIITILTLIILFFIAPKKINCTLSSGITKETVTATFRGKKLKYIKVNTRATYENKEKAKEGMKLQEFGITAIKNYGYTITSKIKDNTIIIDYYGKVKEIEHNIYTKNINIEDFKKNMQEKSYECK